MTNDETKRFSLREEMIDKYFSMKMIEAKCNGDDARLKFFHESLHLWKKQRSLEIQVAQDVARWQEETDRLNELIPLRGPSRVSVRVTPPNWMSQVPEPLNEVLIVTLILIAWVPIIVTMANLWGTQGAIWFSVLCALLGWAYTLRKIHLRRKGNS